MKKQIFLILFIILANFANSQISYDNSDMPTPGDTFRISTALTAGSVDFTLTGNNYVWNFSSLKPSAQSLDTFISVNSTPVTYWYYFNNPLNPNYKATVVSSDEDIASIPGFTIGNVYSFYKNSSSTYQLVGMGGVFSGIPFPVQFTNVDIIYKFPITPTSTPDSCISSYSVAVPNIAFVSQIKHRKNIVDGYGSLTTPFGVFPNVIRVKSIIHQKDSFYLDSIGIPIPAVERDYIEYKWLAKGYGIPVLQVDVTMGVPTNISYFDIFRNLLSTEETSLQKNSFLIFPNPTSSNFKIIYKAKSGHKINLDFIDITGKILFKKTYSSEINDDFDISEYGKGVYFVRLTTDEIIQHNKIVLQ